MTPKIVELPEEPLTETVLELKEWLIGRVADDNDIVIDDLQEEHAEILDSEDEKIGFKGSDSWKWNVNTVALVKPSDLGQNWSWDGFRRCRHQGKTDPTGAPLGEGVLIYENKDSFQGVFFNGILNRRGVLTLSERKDDRIEKIEGEWVMGLLQGEIRATLVNTGWVEGYYKDGVPHGFFREFGPKCFGNSILRLAGRHYKGVKRGVCWKGMYDCSGWLVGEVDLEGKFTGEDIAYIYPDFNMAIRGTFQDERLVSGRMCYLVGCSEIAGMKKPIFSDVEGPVYEYENPNIKNIANHPLLRDPWEETKVVVKESNLPQGGEGLFAVKDIDAREIVAMYNGIKVRTSTYASDHMPRSDYRIRLNADIDMDIPFGYHRCDQYCATLAHKANHSFLPNVEWTLFEHPRFGLIRSLTAQKPIKQGEEILVNYQMCLAKSPEWYRVIWLQHMRSQKRDDASIARYIDRQYELQGYRIPLPDSEVLMVPEPVGVDLSEVPEEFMQDEHLTDEASAKYAKTVAGVREQEPGEARITEEIEIHSLE